MAEKTKGISVFTGCLVGSKMILNGSDYKNYLDFYHESGIFDNINREKFDKQRAIELGALAKLVEKMCEQGANNEDYRRVVLYGYLLIDAVKYELNFSKAAEDLGIKNLKESYK